MFREYQALVTKVEAFARDVAQRQPDALTCHAGCASCCAVSLTVSPLEAASIRTGLQKLAPKVRAELSKRGREALERAERGESPARCAMLDDDGRCAIYEHRPMVCRTQGHALRYPAGFVPAAAVRKRVAGGEVVHCPLNYQDVSPSPADVLDAERVDQILAVVALRFASDHGLDPHERTEIARLAFDGAC